MLLMEDGRRSYHMKTLSKAIVINSFVPKINKNYNIHISVSDKLIWRTTGTKSFLFGTSQFSVWVRWHSLLFTLSQYFFFLLVPNGTHTKPIWPMLHNISKLWYTVITHPPNKIWVQNDLNLAYPQTLYLLHDYLLCHYLHHILLTKELRFIKGYKIS